MRIIETKAYEFNELNDDAKANAIEEIRNEYYEYNCFNKWAIDDCYLLEPKHVELSKFKEYKDILIKNNRKVYFSLDGGSYIDISKAMEIQNSTLFLKWLGLDQRLIDKVDYTILSDSIEFQNQSDKDFTSIQNKKLSAAKRKFEDHCSYILERIENDIDYRFSDEAIIEEIEANGYEFTENGKKL